MRYLITNLQSPDRDLVEAALRGFPSIEVDYAAGNLALDRVRSRTYAGIILGMGTSIEASRELSDCIREAVSNVPILVVAPDAFAHQVREEKARGKIFAFLRRPIQTVDLYRALDRMVVRGESLASA